MRGGVAGEARWSEGRGGVRGDVERSHGQMKQQQRLARQEQHQLQCGRSSAAGAVVGAKVRAAVQAAVRALRSPESGLIHPPPEQFAHTAQHLSLPQRTLRPMGPAADDLSMDEPAKPLAHLPAVLLCVDRTLQPAVEAAHEAGRAEAACKGAHAQHLLAEGRRRWRSKK